jgi:hypothetical protein
MAKHKKYGTTKEDGIQFFRDHADRGWSTYAIGLAWEEHKAKHRSRPRRYTVGRTPKKRKRNTSHYGNPSPSFDATTLLLLGATLFGMKQAKDKGRY